MGTLSQSEGTIAPGRIALRILNKKRALAGIGSISAPGVAKHLFEGAGIVDIAYSYAGLFAQPWMQMVCVLLGFALIYWAARDVAREIDVERGKEKAKLDNFRYQIEEYTREAVVEAMKPVSGYLLLRNTAEQLRDRLDNLMPRLEPDHILYAYDPSTPNSFRSSIDDFRRPMDNLLNNFSEFWQYNEVLAAQKVELVSFAASQPHEVLQDSESKRLFSALSLDIQRFKAEASATLRWFDEQKAATIREVMDNTGLLR